MNKDIYMDFAASTPVDSAVLRFMNRQYKKAFANTSSNHRLGLEAQKIKHDSLGLIANKLCCPISAIEITSGATESNNLSIQGVVEKAIDKFNTVGANFIPHVIISAIEHPSVSSISYYADRNLIHLDTLPVDKGGVVKLEKLKSLIKPETVLISAMMVNSEIGTIQPLNEISKIINKYRRSQSKLIKIDQNYPLFHSDASQALLTIPINLQKLHVDLLTISSHKIYGPKGVALLYINPVVKHLIKPIFKSRLENSKMRPGTSAVELIAGFAKAIEIAYSRHDTIYLKLKPLQQRLIAGLEELGGTINGTIKPMERVINNVNVSFNLEKKINHEFLQMQLDAAGIMVSTRSACLEAGGEGSEVIQALLADGNVPVRENNPNLVNNNSALRFSMGWETTSKQINRVLQEVDRVIKIQTSI